MLPPIPVAESDAHCENATKVTPPTTAAVCGELVDAWRIDADNVDPEFGFDSDAASGGDASDSDAVECFYSYSFLNENFNFFDAL